MTDPVVFSTSSLREADAAAALLQDHRIPYYRSCHAGGVQRAMPAAPVDFPGLEWLIHVPAQHQDEALAALVTVTSASEQSTPAALRGQRNVPALLVLVIAAAIVIIPLLAWC